MIAYLFATAVFYALTGAFRHQTAMLVNELIFEPRDLWVGAFWDRRADGLHVYVCFWPCLVWHTVWCV